MTRVRRLTLCVVAAAANVGCGGAQLVLKGPLTDQCVSAELKGCEDIAEGATLYADGNAAIGEQKLARGLRANAGKAAELKKFATALQTIGKIPGAGQYTAPIQPAVRLVLQVAQEQELEQEQRNKLASKENAVAIAVASIHATPSLPEPTKRVEAPAAPPISTFWMVAGNALAEQCRFVGTPKMLCLHDSIENAAIVSDIIVSSGCPVDVVVMSHRGLNPDWAVYHYCVISEPRSFQVGL